MAYFSRKYIPQGISWKIPKESSNPFFDDHNLAPNEYLVHISFFKEVVLKLPFGPLMVDFLRCLIQSE